MLRIVNKGETLESSVREVRKVKEAGIKASIMILNGLGGPTLSRDHAVNSAKYGPAEHCLCQPSCSLLSLLWRAPGSCQAQ